MRRMGNGDQSPANSQLDKFKAAARELGVDDQDEEGFTEAVRRVAAHRTKKDAAPSSDEERP